MTIEDIGSVDALGISNCDGKAVLTIFDHLSWDDERSYVGLLEKKINTYLKFIKSGQLVEVSPKSRDRAIRIELIYQYPPSESACKILSTTTQQLQSVDIEFVYKPLPEKFRASGTVDEGG